RDGRVTLISRNGKDWTAAFPEIAAAASALPTKDALIDVEVAIVLPDGRTSFQMLQNSAQGEASASAKATADKSGGTLIYFAVDLPRLDGGRNNTKTLLGA